MSSGFQYKTVTKARGECIKGKIVKVKTAKLPIWRYHIEYKCASCEASSSTSEFKNLKEARCMLGSIVLQPCEHCHNSDEDDTDSDTDDDNDSDDSDVEYKPQISAYVTLTRL